MRIGTSLKSGSIDHRRAGGRAMDGRAGAGVVCVRDSIRCSSVTTTRCRCPTTRTSRSSAGSSPSGTVDRRGCCSSSPSGTRCSRPSSSARSPRSTTVRSCCSARSAATSRSSARWEPIAGAARSRFEASLDIIRRLLREEKPSTPTARTESRARGSRRCRPNPSRCGSARRRPRRSTGAARLGDGFLVGPKPLPPRSRELIDVYKERCEANGRTPEPLRSGADIHVARAAPTRNGWPDRWSPRVTAGSMPPRRVGQRRHGHRCIRRARGDGRNRRDRAAPGRRPTRGARVDRPPRRGPAPAHDLTRRRPVVDEPIRRNVQAGEAIRERFRS